MRLLHLATAGFLSALATGCMLQPKAAPERADGVRRINPYHRDKIPDTPYEIRKAEMERDAERTEPTYPPLFKGQKEADDTQ